MRVIFRGTAEFGAEPRRASGLDSQDLVEPRCYKDLGPLLAKGGSFSFSRSGKQQ